MRRPSGPGPRSWRDGEAYRLTGTKIWISNAPEAERYLVFATVDPEAGSKGITAFLVEKGMPGFRFGAHERKMGIRACPAAELVFEGCEVPVANRLGEEGEGYRIALSALGEGRISIAAACVGLARAGLEAAAGYLGERTAFGGPLSEQQGLRFTLAEMARDVAAARALTREAAAAKDRGEPLAEVSSLAKWTASDVAMRVATDAVQLFGASGYSRETGVERLMRDAKGAQIYEGTNQIHREIVAGEVLKRASGGLMTDGASPGSLPERDLAALGVADQDVAALALDVGDVLDECPAVGDRRVAGLLEIGDRDEDPDRLPGARPAGADRAAGLFVGREQLVVVEPLHGLELPTGHGRVEALRSLEVIGGEFDVGDAGTGHDVLRSCGCLPAYRPRSSHPRPIREPRRRLGPCRTGTARPSS